MVTVSHIAKELSVDPKTVRRYIQRGWLEGQLVENTYEVSDIDALLFIFSYVHRKHLGDEVKSMYALQSTGVSLDEIAQHYDIDKLIIESGIDFYMKQRASYLRGYLADEDPKSLFFVEEVLGRLGISHPGPVYHLLEDESITGITTVKGNGPKHFIHVQSVVHYLGMRSNQVLYNSKQVAHELQVTRERVDRIALRENIGFKLRRNAKNTIYLFDQSDILRMECFA